jgi:D-alanyl-D-alanine carboxypeptidase
VEEKLSLEDKLSKFYPDWPRADEVTIRMMCNMSSGIFDITGNPDFFAQLGLNPLKNWTPDELINFAKDKPYYFNPGTGFHYSNTNTTLIGMIIEKITGNTLHHEIKTRIIEKLSLSNTFIPNDQYFPSGFSYSKGYAFESNSYYKVDVTEKYSPTCSWSAGELISNFNDLKVWAEALAEGKLVTTSIQAERLQTVSPCWTGVPYLEKVKYGLGIMNFLGYIGHGGDQFGYHGYICYDPIKKIGAVVLYNYEGSAISTTQEVLKIVDPTL